MSQHSAKGKAWEQQRQRVLARDGWQCSACYKHLAGDDATVDHINPIAINQGKDYRDDELTSLCRTCNSRKGDRVAIRIDYRNPRWFA